MSFRSIFILSVLLIEGVFVYATDSLTVKVKNNLEPLTKYTGFVRQNPSAMLYTRYSDITEFSLNLERDNGKAALLQNGTRKDEFSLNVNTVQHLKNNLVWGQVAYRNGAKDNVRWNECSDYLLVYPYVMNDTIGGNNLKMEEYAFSGGYAQHLNRWTLGFELDYRALKEYRTLDPRPDNTVSDLYFRTGTSYKLTSDYRVGVGLYYRKYKQENNLKFYSSLGAPWIYHDTGLGTNAYMFAGTKSKSMLDGHGYGVNFQLLPENFYGFKLSLDYDVFNYEKQLTSEGYLPLSEINENKISANIAFTKKSDIRIYGAKLTTFYKDRKGTEHLYNLIASNVYDKISSPEMYGHKVGFAELSFIYGIEKETETGVSWSLLPFVSYTDSKEKYKSPKRQINYSAVSEGLKLHLSTPLKKILLTGGASISATQNTSKKIALTGLREEAYSSMILNANYKYLSSNNITYQASLRADYPLSNNIGLFLHAEGRYSSHSHNLHRYNLNLSVGLVF